MPAARDLRRAGPPASCRSPARRRSARSRRTTTCSTSTTCSASGSSTTRLHRNVTIREENAAAALEVMSRFAANPKWLIYLPPTMSPSETTQRRRPARASGRSVRLLPRQRRADGRRRAEAHGLARHRDRLPERGRGPRALRHPRGRGRHLLHAHRPAILRRRRAGTRAAGDGSQARSTAAGSGSSSRPTGCASIAS